MEDHQKRQRGTNNSSALSAILFLSLGFTFGNFFNILNVDRSSPPVSPKYLFDVAEARVVCPLLKDKFDKATKDGTLTLAEFKELHKELYDSATAQEDLPQVNQARKLLGLPPLPIPDKENSCSQFARAEAVGLREGQWLLASGAY